MIKRPLAAGIWEISYNIVLSDVLLKIFWTLRSSFVLLKLPLLAQTRNYSASGTGGTILTWCLLCTRRDTGIRTWSSRQGCVGKSSPSAVFFAMLTPSSIYRSMPDWLPRTTLTLSAALRSSFLWLSSEAPEAFFLAAVQHEASQRSNRQRWSRYGFFLHLDAPWPISRH